MFLIIINFFFLIGISARQIPYDEQRSIYCLPVTIFPSQLNRVHFKTAQDIQKSVHCLLVKTANRHDFLEENLKNLPDPFVVRLYDIYDTVMKNGYAAKHQMCLSRSDYMIDVNNRLKQVEVNTIASGFCGIAPKVTELHRYTLQRYCGLSNKEINAHIPSNSSALNFANAFVHAHSAYGRMDAGILFLVQEQESNVMDQKLLEKNIYSITSDIKIYRRTFKQLEGNIKLGSNRELILTINKGGTFEQPVEICVVYFRTGYKINDYPNEHAWNIRLLIEQSTAIKCPSIQFQLAGFKQLQKKLTDRKLFEQMMECNGWMLYETFCKFWNLNSESKEMVEKDPDRFVLKSNNEGGGYNVFGQEITKKIDELLKNKENDAYFLMEYIRQFHGKTLMINREVMEREAIQYHDINSELGIYGVLMTENGSTVSNFNAGHLMRSKYKEYLEGGVSSGYGMLDSPYLIDDIPDYD